MTHPNFARSPYGIRPLPVTSPVKIMGLSSHNAILFFTVAHNYRRHVSQWKIEVAHTNIDTHTIIMNHVL